MSNPRYPEEFKIQAVNLVTEKKLPVADVAARLGVSTHSLYAWIKRYSKPQAERQQDDDQHAELRRLRAELKRVTEERDILKNRLPGAPRPIGLETLRSTLILLDSGRWLFGGLVPVKKLDPGEAADRLVVARSVTPFRKVI